MDAEALFNDNLALANSCVTNFFCRNAKYRGFSREELRTAALLGLWDAARRFDPSRGVRFSTFAYATMFGAMNHWIREAYFPRRVGRMDFVQGGVNFGEGNRPFTMLGLATDEKEPWRARQVKDAVAAVLKVCKPEWADAIRLVYLHGNSPPEAAVILGVSASLVYLRIRLGFRRIRSWLKDRAGEFC